MLGFQGAEMDELYQVILIIENELKLSIGLWLRVYNVDFTSTIKFSMQN